MMRFAAGLSGCTLGDFKYQLNKSKKHNKSTGKMHQKTDKKGDNICFKVLKTPK